MNETLAILGMLAAFAAVGGAGDLVGLAVGRGRERQSQWDYQRLYSALLDDVMSGTAFRKQQKRAGAGRLRLTDGEGDGKFN